MHDAVEGREGYVMSGGREGGGWGEHTTLDAAHVTSGWNFTGGAQRRIEEVVGHVGHRLGLRVTIDDGWDGLWPRTTQVFAGDVLQEDEGFQSST